MMRTILFAVFFALTAMPISANANAQKPQLLVTHKDWSVYKLQQGTETVYYALTYPKQSKGNYTRRGDVYLLVTSRPKDKSYNVVSFHAGYPFKEGATVTIKIDDQAFTAFSSGETCWFPDDLDDKVVSAFTKGKTVIVEGQSARGTKTVDTFSLAGSGAALTKLKEIAKKG